MRAISGLVRAGQLPICINVALDAKKASGGVQKVASEQELGMQRGGGVAPCEEEGRATSLTKNLENIFRPVSPPVDETK